MMKGKSATTSDVALALRQKVFELEVLATCRGLKDNASRAVLQQLMSHIIDTKDVRGIMELVGLVDNVLGQFNSRFQLFDRHQQGLKLRAGIKDGRNDREESVEKDG